MFLFLRYVCHFAEHCNFHLIDVTYLYVNNYPFYRIKVFSYFNILYLNIAYKKDIVEINEIDEPRVRHTYIEQTIKYITASLFFKDC